MFKMSLTHFCLYIHISFLSSLNFVQSIFHLLEGVLDKANQTAKNGSDKNENTTRCRYYQVAELLEASSV
jgi:hypothetical protein